MGVILDKIISSPDDNLETFTLIWLDANVNRTKENTEAQGILCSTINQLKPFSDPRSCEEYILSLPNDDRIVLIVSGQLGRDVVPKFHRWNQVLSIYVFCYNQELNEQWAVQYPKVIETLLLVNIIKFL